jgi:macrolide transport system ATP-binding/permease protein
MPSILRRDARAAWIAPWLDGFGQDTRYALRALFRERSFALVAIATLTAAIGLNTTIFTIFNALVLAPWPVAEPSRVVTVQNTSAADVGARGGGAPGGFSFDEIDYLREHSRTLTGMAAIRSGGGDTTLGDDDTPASWVSGNYFSLLGVDMALGRGFLPHEDAAASPSSVAVLSFLSPIDPLAHVSVLILLAWAGLAATFLPARRASRIAPVDALRTE